MKELVQEDVLLNPDMQQMVINEVTSLLKDKE